jgi:DNA-binding NtrC family response regulator
MNLTRLLLIDDDVKLCRLLADYLNPLGYEVVAAYSGQDGLERALHEDFAAVILDVMLPGMNGLEVLRELRRRSNVPVLMLTLWEKNRTGSSVSRWALTITSPRTSQPGNFSPACERCCGVRWLRPNSRSPLEAAL